ncbi:SDR family oxidoreductase, partial [bacterium]|nr:SDR family oxidoreductase [bacterium]
MKVLVLGKTGMLGHIVYEYLLEQGYQVIGTTRNEYDASKDDIRTIIEQIQPSVVINCIAILNKKCDENKALAIKINSYLPHYLDELSKEYNFYFIHISTDGVFEGTIGNYNEQSIPDATSFYGRTKTLGEVINDRNVTLRTSIVGLDDNPNGIGLFQWFMNQENKVSGYNKVMWTGVTTIELAKQIQVAIENNLTGLQHIVNNDTISKKNLLEL